MKEEEINRIIAEDVVDLVMKLVKVLAKYEKTSKLPKDGIFAATLSALAAVVAKGLRLAELDMDERLQMLDVFTNSVTDFPEFIIKKRDSEEK